MSPALNFTYGMNYLFHGMNEQICRKTILDFIEREPNEKVVFFPWTTPEFDKLSLHHYSDAGQKRFDIDSFIEGNKKFSWYPHFKKGKVKSTNYLHDFLCQDKYRYIILDAVHVIAHAGASPQEYYKNLLAVCNFHTHTNVIHFIISCARVPVVFQKENPFRHLWEFVAVDSPYPDIQDLAQNKYRLHQFVGALLKAPSPCVFEKIESRLILKTGKDDYPEIKENNAAALDAGLCEAVNGVCASLDLFLSTDIYLSEKTSPALSAETRVNVNKLREVIVGQDEALQRLIDRVLISQNPADPDAIRNETKPRCVFLFVGPSGVGKTRISQELAVVLPEYKFLQINLAEYPDKESVNKLIGVGRGYEESEQGGILTEPVRLHSKYVLLFDELDQAHNSVGQLFYKIFEGGVTDGRGRPVSFRNCYIIMTTNEGALAESSKLPPFERSQLIEQELKKVAAHSDKLKFTDAFLGRIDETIPFRSLSVQDLAKVARNYFNTSIRGPYRKIGITDFRFELKGLAAPDSLADPYPLITHGILDPESLFFEKWALLAGHENSQGARKLFRIMDDYLIRPLELARIKCPSGHSIVGMQFLFEPVMTDETNFATAHIAVIDDKPDEVQYLSKIFTDPWWHVVLTGFDDIAPVKAAQVILLDLYRDGQYGIPVQIPIDQTIAEIRDINPIAPIILHSSLTSGPRRDQLITEQWRSGAFGYLAKDKQMNTDYIMELVSKAVRSCQATAKRQVKLKKFAVKPPKSYDASVLKFEYSYEQA